MKMNQREQILVGTIAGLVVLFGAWFAATSAWDYWRSLNGTLVTRRRELAGMQAAIMQSPEWRQKTEKLRAGMQSQQKNEPMTDGDLMKLVEELTKQTGVKINTQHSLKTVEHNLYRELALRCSFDATTPNLVHFLYAIQIKSGLITVEELQLTPRPDKPSVLRGDIQLRVLTDRGRKGAS